MPPISPVLPIS